MNRKHTGVRLQESSEGQKHTEVTRRLLIITKTAVLCEMKQILQILFTVQSTLVPNLFDSGVISFSVFVVYVVY